MSEPAPLDRKITIQIAASGRGTISVNGIEIGGVRSIAFAATAGEPAVVTLDIFGAIDVEVLGPIIEVKR